MNKTSSNHSGGRREKGSQPIATRAYPATRGTVQEHSAEYGALWAEQIRVEKHTKAEFQHNSWSDLLLNRGSDFDCYVRAKKKERIEKLGAVSRAAEEGIVPTAIAARVAEVIVSDLLDYKNFLTSRGCWIEWRPFLATLDIPRHITEELF